MSAVSPEMAEDLLPAMPLAEVIASVTALTAGQKTALYKIARLYSGKTPYSSEDLIQEAYSRVLAGDRKWRKDLPAVTFLSGVMRSIAWEWKRDGGSDAAEIELSDEGVQARGVGAKMDVERVLSLFDDDPAAKRLAMEMMVGATAEEMQVTCGLNQTEYESKRKKIRRRIEKLELL